MRQKYDMTEKVQISVDRSVWQNFEEVDNMFRYLIVSASLAVLASAQFHARCEVDW